MFVKFIVLLLKLDSLHVGRIKQDLIWCYTIIKGSVAIDYSEFFSFNDCDRTRVHNLKLYIQNCRLDARKFSFARRVRPVWNTLSHDVVNAFSINFFKRKVDAVN